MNTKQLKEFRKLLLQELESAAESVRRDKSDAEEAEQVSFSLDEGDLASRNHNRAVLHAMTEAHARRLKLIERAIERIDRGVYGSCKRCEGDIELKRLAAMPWATLCLECQTELEVCTPAHPVYLPAALDVADA